MLSSIARRSSAVARRGVSTAALPITVAHGDGIGPEIMAATLDVLTAAGANIKVETIDIGEKMYLSGHSSGIAPSSWESLRRTKTFLKAPITTPMGGGYKSASAAARARARRDTDAAASHRPPLPLPPHRRRRRRRPAQA